MMKRKKKKLFHMDIKKELKEAIDFFIGKIK